VSVTLVSVIGHNAEVLPHWLSYYSERVDGYRLFAHKTNEYEEIADILSTQGIAFQTLDGSKYDWALISKVISGAISEVSGWSLIADSDEIVSFEASISDVARMCERDGYLYATGIHVDRLSATGALTATVRQVDLLDQYPIGAFVGFPLCRAQPRKVVLATRGVEVTTGQHNAIINGRTRYASSCEYALHPRVVTGQINHFKWNQGLRNRLTNIADTCDVYNAHEYQDVRSYLAKNNYRVMLDEERFRSCDMRGSYFNHGFINRLLDDEPVLSY
jgi:hypothetical protein